MVSQNLPTADVKENDMEMIDHFAVSVMIGLVLLIPYLLMSKALFKRTMAQKTVETGDADWYYRKPTPFTLIIFPVVFPLIMVIRGLKFLIQIA